MPLGQSWELPEPIDLGMGFRKILKLENDNADNASYAVQLLNMFLHLLYILSTFTY